METVLLSSKSEGQNDRRPAPLDMNDCPGYDSNTGPPDCGADSLATRPLPQYVSWRGPKVLGESIYEKKANLEQIGTKGFSMVFISIGFAEQHSIN